MDFFMGLFDYISTFKYDRISPNFMSDSLC